MGGGLRGGLNGVIEVIKTGQGDSLGLLLVLQNSHGREH